MSESKKMFSVNLVNVLVAVAILMILSALVVPVFVPPESRAASRGTTAAARTARVKR